MRLALGFSTVLLTVCATVAVPLVAAAETRMPTIPDNNQAQEHTVSLLLPSLVSR
ncbi:hypothetical protein [Corynebacterium matruchotii]|uniref:Uncharacterized protein n=1 Tax=Corynebacterium matruchotii ATCC 33806 TaxID=566549 RepID=C0DZ86_9CORY|nr:hypothetical protein CORMATOL_00082 [Corynebacterium matruchotii ATCC 33806]